MIGQATSPADQPQLIVVVDTEEEFDWSAPFDRSAIGVGHVRHIGRLQTVCERWGVRPVYVIDYPVATSEAGITALRPLLEQGRALVGAHLHPWVSPPHEEEVNHRNSFPGNLPPALERSKLAALSACIERSLGVYPQIYKAGRYGIGPEAFATLEALGFTVDLSPAPPFDYRSSGGPDFTHRGLDPEWVGLRRSVLSIPGTGALVGHLPNAALYAFAASPAGMRLRLPGILTRLGVIERIRLSPEGHCAAEMLRLVRWLLAREQRLFVLSLHSPSLEPGHTPYVRSDAQLAAFLETLETFLQDFFTLLGGVPTDPLAVRAEISASPVVSP